MKPEIVAYHEAAHAVAHVRLELPLTYVTIVADDDYAGCAYGERPKSIVDKWNDGDRDDAEVRHYVERELVNMRVANIAQRKKFPRSPTNDTHKLGDERFLISGSDTSQMARIADDLFGGDEDVAIEYLQFINARAHSFVRRHWPDIERVALALLEHKTLTADQVREAMTPPELKRFALPETLIKETSTDHPKGKS